MKFRHSVVLALVIGIAVVATGCSSHVGEAAEIGNKRISDRALQKIVNQQLADPEVRAAVDQKFGDKQGPYRQLILNYSVRHQLTIKAAEQFHVSVPDTAVNDRIAFLVAQAGSEQKLKTALSAALLVNSEFSRNLIRDELLQAEIGYTSASLPRLSDEQLRAHYQSNIPRYSTYQVGVIEVPDEKTGKAVVASLHRAPQDYPIIAAQHSAVGTLTSIQPLDIAQIPDDLRIKLDKARFNDAFFYTLPANTGSPGGHRVVMLQAKTVIPFEQIKAKLLDTSASAAQKAALPVLNKVASQLHISINPRYGKWDRINGEITDTPDTLVITRHNEPAEPLS